MPYFIEISTMTQKFKATQITVTSQVSFSLRKKNKFIKLLHLTRNGSCIICTVVRSTNVHAQIHYIHIYINTYIWPNSEKNEEEVLQRVTEGINILRTMKQMKANWICHILRRKCLLKHIIERKIEATRQGIRHEQPLDDLT